MLERHFLEGLLSSQSASSLAFVSSPRHAQVAHERHIRLTNMASCITD